MKNYVEMIDTFFFKFISNIFAVVEILVLLERANFQWYDSYTLCNTANLCPTVKFIIFHVGSKCL